jgi:glycine/D-amino acid oxidase-like deaminating enzyme/nitrite reductase/ring-hydroxylating ferredoxin subunit
MTHQNSTFTPWSGAAPEFDHNSPQGDLVCDVCVIGAGIAGLSTAYELTREGRRVIVIDKGSIGSGETLHTTAHLSNAIDDRYVVIRELHGTQGARICADSHSAAIDRIEQIAHQEKIDCDFTRLDGFLFLPPGESVKLLEQELEAARDAGVPEVEWMERAPLESFDTGPCLRWGRQAQLHPLKYLAGLAAAIERHGGEIYCDTEMRDVTGDAPLQVELAGGRTIRASSVVVATNTPSINRVTIHTKQAPYRTYAIGIRVPIGAIPQALYWDTSQEAGAGDSASYHYVRLAKGEQTHLQEGFQRLIVGGEDHKTGQADDADQRWSRLEEWARERFASLGEVELRWSGQVLEPVDCVAFIGPNPGARENMYIVTGDSGMGMTHGAIAGLLLKDLIADRKNPWASLYDPSRISLRSGLNFARQGLNMAAQYAAWLQPGEVASVNEIPNGTGAVMRHGLSLLAVYRDEKGMIHEHSAVCPHLGGIVAWNSAERTWDCPCHGSRFGPCGDVITGPAVSGLKPADRPLSIAV